MIRKPSTQDGFTLIELLVVVVIIGILASVAVPNFMGAQDKAKNSGVQSNAHNVQMSLEQYAVDNASVFPAALTGAANVVGNATYLSAFPRTPWNTQQAAAADIVIPVAATDVLLSGTGKLNPTLGTTAAVAGSGTACAAITDYGAISYRRSGTAAEKYELMGTGKQGGNAIKIIYVKNY